MVINQGYALIKIISVLNYLGADIENRKRDDDLDPARNKWDDSLNDDFDRLFYGIQGKFESRD